MFLGLIYSRLTAANNSLYVEEHIRGQRGKALLHIVSELERKFASLNRQVLILLVYPLRPYCVTSFRKTEAHTRYPK